MSKVFIASDLFVHEKVLLEQNFLHKFYILQQGRFRKGLPTCILTQSCLFFLPALPECQIRGVSEFDPNVRENGPSRVEVCRVPLSLDLPSIDLVN